MCERQDSVDIYVLRLAVALELPVRFRGAFVLNIVNFIVLTGKN